MNRIDVLALAIANLNGAFTDPESEAFETANPGLLKAHSLESLGSANKDCTRIFSTVQGGYKALTDLLEKQCDRHRNMVLQAFLTEHFRIGNQFAIGAVVEFVRQALGDKTVSESTYAKYFME